jgi:hypothetical protein
MFARPSRLTCCVAEIQRRGKRGCEKGFGAADDGTAVHFTDMVDGRCLAESWCEGET